MGFSLIGTLIAMVILAPSLLMIKFPPDHVPSGLKDLKHRLYPFGESRAVGVYSHSCDFKG